MPCGQFETNAMYFAIGVLAYNLAQVLRRRVLPAAYRTATVATLGMLPAALHTGVGSDVQRGIATVVVGGLAVATLDHPKRTPPDRQDRIQESHHDHHHSQA